jgi:hypothetical protein
MSAQMVNQRWKIKDQEKNKIELVCNETSTSAQQKHDKIEGIHEETAAEIAKFIPLKELREFNKCEAALESSRPKKAGQKEVGPCGGVIPADHLPTDDATSHQQSHKEHSSEAQKPNDH